MYYSVINYILKDGAVPSENRGPALCSYNKDDLGVMLILDAFTDTTQKGH